jgi:transposase
VRRYRASPAVFFSPQSGACEPARLEPRDNQKLQWSPDVEKGAPPEGAVWYCVSLRMPCRLTDFRRIATRYDRLAINFVAAVCPAATVSHWL